MSPYAPPSAAPYDPPSASPYAPPLETSPPLPPGVQSVGFSILFRNVDDMVRRKLLEVASKNGNVNSRHFIRTYRRRLRQLDSDTFVNAILDAYQNENYTIPLTSIFVNSARAMSATPIYSANVIASINATIEELLYSANTTRFITSLSESIGLDALYIQYPRISFFSIPATPPPSPSPDTFNSLVVTLPVIGALIFVIVLLMYINYRLRVRKLDSETIPVAEISSDEESLHNMDMSLSTDNPAYSNPPSPIVPVVAQPPFKPESEFWYSQRV